MNAKPEALREYSLFARIGKKAATKAQRKLLLAALGANKWNLTKTAIVLELSGPGNVLREIRRLGLTDKADAARASGLIRCAHKGESARPRLPGRRFA